MGKKEQNEKNKKIKRIAVKIVAWLFLTLIISSFIIMLYNETLGGYVFLGSSIIFLAWLYLFAKYFEPLTKAYKFELIFTNFDEIINYLDKNVFRIGFSRYYHFDSKKAIVYYRLKKTSLSYFFVLKQGKILDNKRNTLKGLDKIKEEFIDILYQELSEKEKKFNYFEENYFFIIDEENDVFRKIMNTNVFGEYKQTYIFTGYSFKTNFFYVAQQKEGNYLNYRILRNKVLKVMNLKMKKRIKN